MDAEAIVKRLASEEPCYAGFVDGTPYCFFCSSVEPLSPEDHHTTCLWLAAVRLAKTYEGTK